MCSGLFSQFIFTHVVHSMRCAPTAGNVKEEGGMGEHLSRAHRMQDVVQRRACGNHSYLYNLLRRADEALCCAGIMHASYDSKEGLENTTKQRLYSCTAVGDLLLHSHFFSPAQRFYFSGNFHTRSPE